MYIPVNIISKKFLLNVFCKQYFLLFFYNFLPRANSEVSLFVFVIRKNNKKNIFFERSVWTRRNSSSVHFDYCYRYAACLWRGRYARGKINTMLYGLLYYCVMHGVCVYYLLEMYGISSSLLKECLSGASSSLYSARLPRGGSPLHF